MNRRCVGLISWANRVSMRPFVRESGVVARRFLQLRCLGVLVMATPVVISSSSLAQGVDRQHEPDSFVRQQRAVDERIRRRFDEQMDQVGRATFDWGGWYSFHAFVFDDGVESSRTLRRHDLRLWGRWVLDGGTHEFYVRGRTSLLDFNAGDSFDRNEDDVEGPNLERGFYRLNLTKAWPALRGGDSSYDIVATFGRDLVQFGTGIALATPLDHVALRVRTNAWEFMGLAGKTVGSSRDFDLSRTAKRLRRNFLGAQVTYRGFERHEPFAYALWQRDHNREAFYQPFQKYNYDSFYLGVGSTGELTERLRYAAELVYESGHSFNNRRFLRNNDIEAWAVKADLEYLFPGARRARTSVGYLFGSGDSDRRNSPTNTVGGNRRDFEDDSFVSLGYHDTGLALAPRYSNLHTWRAGASFYPWPDDERFRRLEVGTDWYLFYKHHAGGAISDATADVASGYVGWEMDYFVNWRVASDFAWTARLGVFFPGRAFSDRTTRTFLLVGGTWSF